MTLERIARALARECDELRFGGAVTHVYNPTSYAWPTHREYLRRFGGLGAKVVMIGMNPGPWGMAQTGVPFGEVELVRDWMGIEGKVGAPPEPHPKRPVQGFACTRSEVSGRRLWGWARERFGAAEHFFERFFVANYCPLSFMEASARNVTPDKLPAAEREPLLAACDQALRELVAAMGATDVVGIGKWAETRAKLALNGTEVRVSTVLHPSPASPIANRGWAPQAERQLKALGLL